MNKNLADLMQELEHNLSAHKKLQKDKHESMFSHLRPSDVNQVTLKDAVNLVQHMKLHSYSSAEIIEYWPTKNGWNFVDHDIVELAIKLVFGHKYDFYA